MRSGKLGIYNLHNPLRYYDGYPLLAVNISLLWYVFSWWRGCFCSFKTSGQNMYYHTHLGLHNGLKKRVPQGGYIEGKSRVCPLWQHKWVYRTDNVFSPYLRLALLGISVSDCGHFYIYFIILFVYFFYFDMCQMTGDMWHVPRDTWRVTRDSWHVTCDMWHVTCHMWHMTHDT